MKNKIKLAGYAVSSALLLSPAIVLGAWGVPDSATAGGIANTSVGQLLSNILNWILSIVGIAGVIAFAVAGLLYLTAGGEEKKIEKAKHVMVFAIVGVVVAVIGLIAVNAISQLFVSGNTTA
ncbi:MAG: hypothetical protein WAV31_00490 [Candidatus Moraniibacteriota bacterium]